MYFNVNKTIEHEISTAHNNENAEKNTFLAFKLSDVVSIMLIKVEMQTISGNLTFKSMINFMLS